MFNSHYIDDIFVDLYSEIYGSDIWYRAFQSHDRSAMQSFNSVLSNGQPLTESQSNYVIKLLTKYKGVLTSVFDYTHLLADPKWSKPFRIIDLTRRIWVEQERNSVNLVLKFPYSVKDSFDDEIINTDYIRIRSQWDSERKVRMVNAYDINLMKLNHWLEEHNFELDPSYEDFMATVEEIVNDEEGIIPGSTVKENQVVLINAPQPAQEYFDEHKVGDLENDLWLAKLMGFAYKDIPKTMLEKICAHEETKFRIPDLGRALKLSETIQGKKVILLDRADDYKLWMKNLHNFLINHNIDINKFVLCHRENNQVDSKFNDWIKDVGFGGKTEDADYLIFLHRPKKWLISNDIDVKIVFTTGLWDTRDSITRAFIDSVGCDINISKTKPTKDNYPHPEWHMHRGGTAERVEL